MLLKYFYDRTLAHASYLVGCQKTGEAIVIDPGRDVEPYLEVAKREQLHIVGSAETHIHADFVSGSRELVERTGARLYLSDADPADWKYLFAIRYDSVLLKRLANEAGFRFQSIEGRCWFFTARFIKP
jgi:hydroxyacylglutathione hydrolase